MAQTPDPPVSPAARLVAADGATRERAPGCTEQRAQLSDPPGAIMLPSTPPATPPTISPVVPSGRRQ